MGKITLNVEVDAELVSQVEGAGLDPVEAAREGIHRAAERTRRAAGAGRSAARRPQPGAPDAAERLAAEWGERNREALDEHRRLIETRGSFADSARRW